MLKTFAGLLCAMGALAVASPSHAGSAIPMHLTAETAQPAMAEQNAVDPTAPGFMTVQYHRPYYHHDYHRRYWHRSYYHHHRHGVRIGPVVIR